MLVNIAVYKIATGEVDRVCSVAESDTSLQIQNGEDFVEITDENVITDVYKGNYKKYRVVGNVLILLPNQPSQSHVFDYLLGQWIDPRTLTEVKADQWEAIKIKREAIINAHLETPYGQVDSGPRDRINITNSVMMLQTLAGLGTPGTVQFTMADNSTIEFDVNKMVHVGLLLGQKIEAAHATARALRQAIDEAQTVEEVLAITWS